MYKPLRLYFYFSVIDISIYILGAIVKITKYGISQGVQDSITRHLLLVLCNIMFIYLYTRDKLFAWYAAFFGVIGTLLLFIMEEWSNFNKNSDKFIGAILFSLGIATYLLYQYRAYEQYVKEQSEQNIEL